MMPGEYDSQFGFTVAKRRSRWINRRRLLAPVAAGCLLLKDTLTLRTPVRPSGGIACDEVVPQASRVFPRQSRVRWMFGFAST